MLRILSLEKFSTEGFKINDQAVEPTPETKRKVAAFFAFHLLLAYLVDHVDVNAAFAIAAVMTPVYIVIATNALTDTANAGANPLYGHALTTKAAPSGPLTVRIAN